MDRRGDSGRARRRAAAILGVGLALLGAAAAGDPLDRTGWPREITIAAAPPGGVYFVYAGALARLFEDRLGLEGGAEPTGGSVQNLALVHAGDMVIGLASLAPAAEALSGRSPIAPGLRMEKLRAIFPLYETYFSLAARRDLDLDAVSELPQGARVGVGPEAGAAHVYFPEMLSMLGVAVTPVTGSYEAMATAFRDGELEALALAAGAPNPLYRTLEREGLLEVVGFTASERERLSEVFPVAPALIPAAAYRTLEADAGALALWNVAIANADLPESLVYALVDAVMTSNAELVAAHGAARATRAENVIWNTVLPWHPGAVRWFEENGVVIPDHLRG